MSTILLISGAAVPEAILSTRENAAERRAARARLTQALSYACDASERWNVMRVYTRAANIPAGTRAILGSTGEESARSARRAATPVEEGQTS